MRGKSFPIWKGNLSSHFTDLYDFNFQQLYLYRSTLYTAWNLVDYLQEMCVIHACADGKRLKGICARREKQGLPQRLPWGNFCARKMLWCRSPSCHMAWGQKMQTEGMWLTSVCLGTQRKATGGAEIKVSVGPTPQLRNHTRFFPHSLPLSCA